MSAAAEPSPRTTERPMAFTEGEFEAGAWRSVGYFVVILPFALSGILAFFLLPSQWSMALLLISVGGVLFLFVVGPIAGVISALVLLATRPLLRRLALRLAAVRSIRAHLAVYATIGATIGAVVTAICVATIPGTEHFLPIGAAIVGSSALGLPLGWWSTMGPALRVERGLPPARCALCPLPRESAV